MMNSKASQRSKLQRNASVESRSKSTKSHTKLEKLPKGIACSILIITDLMTLPSKMKARMRFRTQSPQRPQTKKTCPKRSNTKNKLSWTKLVSMTTNKTLKIINEQESKFLIIKKTPAKQRKRRPLPHAQKGLSRRTRRRSDGQRPLQAGDVRENLSPRGSKLSPKEAGLLL